MYLEYTLADGTIIPADWYKLLVWRENGKLQAEYIFTKHENSADEQNVYACGSLIL